MNVTRTIERADLRDARKRFEQARRDMLAAFTAAIAAGMSAGEAADETAGTASAMSQLAALRDGR